MRATLNPTYSRVRRTLDTLGCTRRLRATPLAALLLFNEMASASPQWLRSAAVGIRSRPCHVSGTMVVEAKSVPDSECLCLLFGYCFFVDWPRVGLRLRFDIIQKCTVSTIFLNEGQATVGIRESDIICPPTPPPPPSTALIFAHRTGQMMYPRLDGLDISRRGLRDVAYGCRVGAVRLT